MLKQVPKEIREWLGSEQTVEAVQALNDKYGFVGDQRKVIAQTLYKVQTKQLDPVSIKTALAKELDIGSEKVEPLVQEIKNQFLIPIGEQLRAYGISIGAPNEKTPQQPATQSVAREVSATPETPTVPTQPTPPIQHSQEVNPPQAHPQQESAIQVAPQTATPFVLHEHKEIESVSSGQEDHTLVRPTFYEEKESQAPQTSFTPTARLDIGSEEKQSAEGPPTIKVGSEHAKVVHYSRPTSNNPFDVKNQNTGPEIKKNPETRVDPSNVVNLKDLPK